MGGSKVASRLVHVFHTLGCLPVPLASVVLSRLGELARRAGQSVEDVYALEDVGLLVDNLRIACSFPQETFRAWPVERTRALGGRYPAFGTLYVDRAPWVSCDAPTEERDLQDLLI